ncbi:transcriptional regulator, AraC family [Actinosynnema pretiosum]|nr:transcriptional regulator, AraC family [Actinosynnema pretiosum]
MRPPWALRVREGVPLTLVSVLRGRAWVVPDGGEAAVAVLEGQVAVVRGDVPHVLADSPATPTTAVITEADYCPGADGVEQAAQVCGVPDERATVLLSGVFERRGELSERLLRALPRVLVTTAEAGAVAVLAKEVVGGGPGQQPVLDRVLDLLLVSALRTWFADPAADVPPWCRALEDPLVGAALRALHEEPARPWTVASLASGVGVSRAALARRFTALVGEPPMAYLAGWRVALAADLLRETDETVAAIARKVGYANAFALSAAFKRLRGSRPSEHRAGRAALTPAGGGSGAAHARPAAAGARSS